MAINPLALRRTRAYLRDCVGYLGICVAEVPVGLAVVGTPLAQNQVFVFAASCVGPLAAALWAAAAESGRRQATWGKARRSTTGSAARGSSTPARTRRTLRGGCRRLSAGRVKVGRLGRFPRPRS